MRNAIKWALGSLALLAACSGPGSVADAEHAVALFHQQLDREDYDGIWKGTATDMRKVTKQAEFAKILRAVHNKLGKVIEAKQVGWQSNVTTNGSFTTLNFDTKFERGTGQENFVFRKEDKKLTLAGYHINSNDMMIN